MTNEEIPYSQRSIRQKTQNMTQEQRESYLSSLAYSHAPEIKGTYIYDSDIAQNEAEEIERVREKIISNNTELLNINKEVDKSALEASIDFYKGKYPDLTSEDEERIRRVYASYRRSGFNPEEATAKTISESVEDKSERSKIMEVLSTHTYGVERKRKNKQFNKKKTTIKEQLGYRYTLENPEDYLYHSSTGLLGNIDSLGLKCSKKQSEEFETSINFWNGNHRLHAGEMEAWNSYGARETLLRVKKSRLIDLGFEIVPEGRTSRAKKIDPVIPPEDLEVWDREFKLWRPVLDVLKEREGNNK